MPQMNVLKLDLLWDYLTALLNSI